MGRPGSPERALLAECALALAGTGRGLAARAAAVDGLAFAELARSAVAAGLAAHALMARGGWSALDPLARARLLDEYECAAATTVLHVHEAAVLQRRLAEAGIESLALKGVALAAAHYPVPAARSLSDADLLVRPADLRRAAALLGAGGRAPACADLPGLDGRPLGEGEAGAPQHLPTRIARSGARVELHWRLPGLPTATDLAPIFADAREVTWMGRRLRVPAATDLLGMACCHALDAHRDAPGFEVRLLADLALLVAEGVDVAAAERRYGGAVSRGLALLATARERPEAAFRTRLAPRGPSTWRALWRAAHRGALLRFLFPARAFLLARYGVSPTARWWPLLWAWRPVGALLRAVGAARGS